MLSKVSELVHESVREVGVIFFVGCLFEAGKFRGVGAIPAVQWFGLVLPIGAVDTPRSGVKPNVILGVTPDGLVTPQAPGTRSLPSPPDSGGDYQ